MYKIYIFFFQMINTTTNLILNIFSTLSQLVQNKYISLV